MKTVSFTHPLTRRISHADIESLPLAATTIKVLKTLFDHYDQDSLDGLSISQAKLASELGLSTTTIARALRQAAESGFLMIFDTYIKGVGQAASRYFFPQSLIVREYAEQIIALPGRASQLRGKSFEDIKPTLIVDKESGKVVDQYFPTEQKPWPVFESQEFAKVRNNNPTVDELIKKLKMAQFYQEGSTYIQHNEKVLAQEIEAQRFSIQAFRRSVEYIINDPGLLATTTWTHLPILLKPEDLRQTADFLREVGRVGWGEYLCDDLPWELRAKVPLLVGWPAQPRKAPLGLTGSRGQAAG